MTKDKFLKWCEDNAHKFVIISYQGGAGGEGVCNWLTKNTDIFYNKTLIAKSKELGLIPDNLIYNVDNKQRKNQLKENDTNNYPSSNRQKTFFDFLFAEAFVLDSVDNLYTSHCWVPEYEQIPVIPDEEFDNPYEKLWNFLSNREDPDGEKFSIVDPELDSICDDFAKQDKPYLIRTHGITPMTMCWGTKAKYFSLSGGNYQEYLQMLEAVKVYLQPEWTIGRKMELIYQWSFRWSKGINGIWGEVSNMYRKGELKSKEESYHEEQKMINYLKPILDNPDMPLYYRTVDILGQPEAFGVDVNTMDAITLNYMVYSIILSKFWPRIGIEYFKNDDVTSKRLEMKEPSLKKVHEAMGDKIDPYDMNWADSERAKGVVIDFWKKNKHVHDSMGIISLTFEAWYKTDWLTDNGIEVDEDNYLMFWNDWHLKNLDALAKLHLYPRRVPEML